MSNVEASDFWFDEPVEPESDKSLDEDFIAEVDGTCHARLFGSCP
jgi:hypothetical protein